MKSFDEFNNLTEVKKFQDSTDATEFMFKINDMLQEKALLDWAKETDSNFSTRTVDKLKKASAAYNKFLEEMMEAG